MMKTSVILGRLTLDMLQGHMAEGAGDMEGLHFILNENGERLDEKPLKINGLSVDQALIEGDLDCDGTPGRLEGKQVSDDPYNNLLYYEGRIVMNGKVFASQFVYKDKAGLSGLWIEDGDGLRSFVLNRFGFFE